MVKKAEKAKKALEILEKQAEAFKDISTGIGTVPTTIANLGMFFVGFNAPRHDAPVARKLIEGLRGVVAFKLAQSPNLPASIFGIGMVTELFGKNLFRLKPKSPAPTEEEVEDYKPYFKLHESYSYDSESRISGKTTSLIKSE